jgi:PAS domain S-box-containing protein
MADLPSDSFRLALERAPTGMLVIDERGVISLVNERLESLFGYSAGELVGCPVEVLVPERFHGRHVEARARFFTAPSVRSMAGRALFGRKKDGSAVLVTITLTPLETATGRSVLGSVSESTSDAGPSSAPVASQWPGQNGTDPTFRAVFEQSPIAMAILDGDLKYTHVNTAWTRTLGYEARELVGKGPAEFTHPDDRAEDVVLVDALVRGEIPVYTRDKRYLRRDGSVVYVQLHAAAVNDASGARYYIGQIQDVTDRVQAEQVARTLQAELAQQYEIGAIVLRNMPRGAVFLVDRELRYVWASGPSVVDLVGTAAEELRGTSAQRMIPDEFQAEVLERLQATLAGSSVEFEAVRGDKIFEVRTAPIYSGEATPVAALVHLYDVTERKRQALALERERERFRTLVQSAPIGIFEMDASGRVVYMNDRWRAVTGVNDEAARSPERRMGGVHPEDRERLLEAWSTAVQRGEGYKVDFRYQAPDAPLKRLTTIATPLRGEGGRVAHFLGVTLDMTAELAAREEIERSLREKETLLKEIHHRVKNNLQVIGSIVELHASRASDEAAQQVFADIRGRIHAIALLHERLYRAPDLAAIDFVEYVRGLVADATYAAGIPAGGARIHAPSESILLSLDEALPVGLITNELVTNAFKHGRRGSTPAAVEVKIAREGDAVLLEVSDDGPGFPPGFEPASVKTLGLVLLRGLAKQLDGEIAFRAHPTRIILRFRIREGR